MTLIDPEQVLVIDYTNHAGKRSMRRIIPVRLWFGVSEHHAEQIGPQWYLRALDIDKGDPDNPRAALPERDFLITSIRETLTLTVWEKRAASDERWKLQRQAWNIAQR